MMGGRSLGLDPGHGGLGVRPQLEEDGADDSGAIHSGGLVEELSDEDDEELEGSEDDYMVPAAASAVGAASLEEDEEYDEGDSPYLLYHGSSNSAMAFGSAAQARGGCAHAAAPGPYLEDGGEPEVEEEAPIGDEKRTKAESLPDLPGEIFEARKRGRGVQYLVKFRNHPSARWLSGTALSHNQEMVRRFEAKQAGGAGGDLISVAKRSRPMAALDVARSTKAARGSNGLHLPAGGLAGDGGEGGDEDEVFDDEEEVIEGEQGDGSDDGAPLSEEYEGYYNPWEASDEWDEDDPPPAKSHMDAVAERQTSSVAAGARVLGMALAPADGVPANVPLRHHVMSGINHPSVVMNLPNPSQSQLHHAAAMGVHQQRALEDDDDEDEDEEEDDDSELNGSKGLRHSMSVASEGEGSDFDRGWVDMVQQEMGSEAVQQDDWPI